MKSCLKNRSLFFNHWYMQRFTNVLMLPLSFWLVTSLLEIAADGIGHIELVRFLSHPFNQYMTIGFVAVLAYHTYLGMYEVFKDYVNCQITQKIIFFLLKLAAFSFTAVTVYTILKINGA